MGDMNAVEMADPPKRPYGPRAPDGAAQKALVLRLPEALYKKASRRARLQGITLSEWIRGAMVMRLDAESAG